VSVVNTLAYYDVATMAVKSFKVQAQGVYPRV
jgi:hypothetical protein